MTRNLKALGLALIAVFAMSAVVASAAQAATFKVTTAESPAILTGSSIGGAGQQFTINPNTAEPAHLKCTGFSGHATVTSGDTSVTVTNIAYSGCTATIGGTTTPATVHMEGCDYTLRGGAATGTADHFNNGEVDLTCGVGVTGPTITVLNAAGARICKYTVWNFANKKEITYTNTTGTPDDIDLYANDVTVEVTRSEGILCPKPDETARYTGELTIKAFKDLGSNPLTEGAQIGATVSVSNP